MEDEITAHKRKSIPRRIFRAFAWLLGLLLLLLLSLVSLLFIYEDEVKAIVVTALNKHLAAEVKIGPRNIHLTVISSFPDCSVEFQQALMLDALPAKQRDTLLFAQRINLHFNVMDLWHKNYTIHKIRVRDAVLKLRVLKDGQVNYIFWKTDTASTASALAFNLEQVSLERCRLLYKDHPAGVVCQAFVPELQLKGRFDDAALSLNSQGEVLVHLLTRHEDALIREKTLSLALDLAADKDHYTISQGHLKLNKLQVDLSGSFNYKDQFSALHLQYNATHLEIGAILSLLPAKIKDRVNDYESAGEFYARGRFDYQSAGHFNSNTDFGIKDGSIVYKKTDMQAKGVRLEGNLTYSDKASELQIRQIELHIKDDALKGRLLIRDFKDPYLEAAVQASIHLENLQAFVPLDTLESVKGNVSIDADIRGRLDDLKHSTFSNKVQVGLAASISNVQLRFKQDERLIDIASGSLTVQDQEIGIQDLKLKRGASDLLLNGRLPGFFNYLSDPTQPLTIQGSLKSDLLRLEDLMVGYKASGGAGPLIPNNIHFKLNAAILKFSYMKFEAGAITGEIEIKDQKAIANELKLEAMDGEATIDAFLDNSHHKLEVVLQSRIKGINISRMFAELNNFGQSTLQDKNIKGFASADLELSCNWSNQLLPDYNSLRATANLSIERGELIDFKPLLSLSRFVEVQDLSHIRFSNLQSNVQIANSTITLPKTSLNNSALNISMWGSHRFNNEIDYHIQLLISELLAKKRKHQDEEFGPVQDDPNNRRSAFILMTGTVDNPIIKYDRKGLKEKVKADIKAEKQNLRRVLKEELGLFKKDSIRKAEKTATVFELEKPAAQKPKKELQAKKKQEDDDF